VIGPLFYEWKITIPATATQANPVRKKLTLKKGILTQFSVLMPEGHHACACLTIWDGERQICPDNSDGRIRGNGETLPIPFFFKIETDFYDLEARGWAEDASEPHDFYLRITVLPESFVLPQLALGRVLEKILGLWTRLTGVR